ncbi:MAG: pyridoxal-dependent decarboxylase [Pseudomonadota bacterium]
MTKDTIDWRETSLDPSDWKTLRALGHRALDDMFDYLATVRERPAWSAIPQESMALFAEPVPQDPMPADDVYDLIAKHILPYPTNNIHPRFWSWVGGTGTPVQLIADLVISAMNSGSLGFDEAASTHVELQLLEWLKTLLQFDSDASGLLVSGGSMANLVGLAVARTDAASYDLREAGADPTTERRLIYYASTETHSSVRKGVELLGLGNRSLRLIPVDKDFRIDLEALAVQIEADKAAGHQPACLVANVGTVNTGAIDPLDALADTAAREDMWLHVDGAFGACAALSPESRQLIQGMERADSIAFDLHKWMYVQYDCGCVLVRSDRPHRETFSVTPAYLRTFERGLASGPNNFSEYGVQLSRSFRALRAWMALKVEGSARYGRQIEQNIRQARYLSDLVDRSAHLERLAPTPLNIVNFRFADARADASRLDDLNAEILMQLHERGIAAPSSTQLNGALSIRVAICNHRSRRDDFDALVENVEEIGRRLAGIEKR